ncbi:helix-turn-helix domain-containing protein [uncultured Megasphaera sp.]|uniref:helix-turn-helix domain-containing protein n=1 Tax=uncultured Megasphaera sp. TaxID=165188 RepID=UPI0025ED940A|nr:helix-turn-helix transcriptional regulator [uncultured Megasphaera sp.]
MYDVEEFSKKIKSLRVAYHLSLAEMANLLSMKSKSPLYAWEKGKAFPNLESLLGLNQYFGITLDWLVDVSLSCYTNGSLRKSEECLFQYLSKDCKADEILAMKSQTGILQLIQKLSDNQYLDLKRLEIDEFGYFIFEYDSRDIWYSLAARANIVFLLQIVPVEDLCWAICYLANDKKKRGILKRTQQYLANLGYDVDKDYKGPGKKALERAFDLIELLKPEKQDIDNFRVIPKQPIYDVEKIYQGTVNIDLCKQKKKLDELQRELEKINAAIAELTGKSADED